MGTFTGVGINKMHGGLVRETDTGDRVTLLVCGGTALSGKLVNYRPLRLDAVGDLEALEWDEAADLKNKELVHYHVSEVFRLSPERPVYLMIVPKADKVSTLTANKDFIAGVRSVNGVNTVGICSLAADTTVDIAVKAAQTLVNSLREEHIYLDAVLLEGPGGYLTALEDATDLRTLDSENVSVVIAQDPAQAAKDEAYKNHAAVGSALGMLSVRYVHENMGSVDIENHPRTAKGTADYPLTSVLLGKWTNAALSNGTAMANVSVPEQNRLTEKGYIFVGGFQGYAGYFFNNSCTCTDAKSDYAYIEYNAVWNKAARLVRGTLLPRVRSKVKSDPATGYISSVTVSDWDARVKSALETMVAAEDISDFDIYINPKQSAVSDKPFNIQVKLVADGIVHEFEIDLGFTNKI